MSETVYTIDQLKERLIPVFIDNSIKKAVLFYEGVNTKIAPAKLQVRHFC